MFRRAPLHLLFALLLLLAQQLAAAHGPAHRDNGSLPHHACQLCNVSAQLGTGLVSAGPLLEAAPRAIEAHAYLASCCIPQLRLAFHSRAPPAA
jgi:hypothetical protein